MKHRIAAVLTLACLALGASGRAAEPLPPPQPGAASSGDARLASGADAHALRFLSRLEPSPHPWGGFVSLSAGRDDNLHRFLANASFDSKSGIVDRFRRASAGLNANPRWKAVDLEVSYVYQQCDYQDHKSYSYRDHVLGGSVRPRLGPGLKLDLGGDLEWISGLSAALARNRRAHVGVVALLPGALRLRTGYEQRHDTILSNALKDADSDSFYMALSRPVGAASAFLHYHFRKNDAVGDNYSYAAHSATLGGAWSIGSEGRLMAWAGYTHRGYDNADTRPKYRGLVRVDDVYSLNLKPSWSFAPFVSAFAGAAWSKNSSNISFKRYREAVFSGGIEARY